MKKLSLPILLSILLLMVVACNSNKKEIPSYNEIADFAVAATEEEVSMETPPVEKSSNSSENNQFGERKLIKEGNIAFETKDLAATQKLIANAVQKNNAYIASERESDEGYRIVSEITIKVPCNNFDLLLSGIGTGVEHFDTKDIRVNDVTAHYYDLEIRIKNKKTLEERYLNLLKQAKTVEEMLEIEREIGSLRGDIESMEGQMKILSNQIAYSTLYVTYYKKTPEGVSTFSPDFKSALKEGWEEFLHFCIAIVSGWPFLLLIGIVTWLLIRFRKRRKCKKRGLSN